MTGRICRVCLRVPIDPTPNRHTWTDLERASGEVVRVWRTSFGLVEALGQDSAIRSDRARRENIDSIR